VEDVDIDGVVVGSAVHVQRVRTIKISDTGLLSTSSLGILASQFLTYLGMFQKISGNTYFIGGFDIESEDFKY
jgi:hypothetical protein